MDSTENFGRAGGLRRGLVHELKSLGLVTLYFGCWLGVLLIIKGLVLKEYDIQFSGLSVAVMGVLVLSKVVLVLGRVPLGTWVREQAAWVDVLLRTALYCAGVFVVLVLEKAFEGRHEYGGLLPSLRAVFQHAQVYHVWVNAIVVTASLLVYNVMSVINLHLGEGGVIRLLMKPLPQQTATDTRTTGATAP